MNYALWVRQILFFVGSSILDLSQGGLWLRSYESFFAPFGFKPRLAASSFGILRGKRKNNTNFVPLEKGVDDEVSLATDS